MSATCSEGGPSTSPGDEVDRIVTVGAAQSDAVEVERGAQLLEHARQRVGSGDEVGRRAGQRFGLKRARRASTARRETVSTSDPTVAATTTNTTRATTFSTSVMVNV